MIGVVQSLASNVGLDFAGALSRLRQSVLQAGAVGIVSLVAAGFALAALTIFLIDLYGPISATAIVSAGLFVLALLLWFALRPRGRNVEQEENGAHQHSGLLEGNTGSLVTALAISAIPMVLRSRTLTVATGIAGLVYLLARNSRKSDPAPILPGRDERTSYRDVTYRD